MVSVAFLLYPGAFAKDIRYIGSVEAISGDISADMARGTVFLDTNRNSSFDSTGIGIEGVLVSNGREIVTTRADGTYKLPVYDDMNFLITKPSGYAALVDDMLIPQFNCIHKVAGSPYLRFGGIDPTGPMPTAVNFPLIKDNSARMAFECLIFGEMHSPISTCRSPMYVKPPARCWWRVTTPIPNAFYSKEMSWATICRFIHPLIGSLRWVTHHNIILWAAITISTSMPQMINTPSIRSVGNEVPNTTHLTLVCPFRDTRQCPLSMQRG